MPICTQDFGRLLNFYYSGLGYFPVAIFTVLLIVIHIFISTCLSLVGVAKLPGDEVNSFIFVLDGAPLVVVTGK